MVVLPRKLALDERGVTIKSGHIRNCLLCICKSGPVLSYPVFTFVVKLEHSLVVLVKETMEVKHL